MVHYGRCLIGCEIGGQLRYGEMLGVYGVWGVSVVGVGVGVRHIVGETIDILLLK